MVFVDERLNGMRARIAGWKETIGGLDTSSGMAMFGSINVFSNVDDLEICTGAFQVVAGAGRAFRWIYIGVSFASSCSTISERLDDGALTANVWFSAMDTEDKSWRAEPIGDERWKCPER